MSKNFARIFGFLVSHFWNSCDAPMKEGIYIVLNASRLQFVCGPNAVCKYIWNGITHLRIMGKST